jgi:acyl carrier protein
MGMVLLHGYLFLDKMKSKKWLIEWFKKNSNISKEFINKNIEENYFNKGWINSLKFILLITDIEEEFEILFSNEEFQNREFSTIIGLSRIIEEKCQ